MKTFRITFRDGAVEEVRAAEFLQGLAHVVFIDGGAQVALVASADIRIVRIIETPPLGQGAQTLSLHRTT